jgi:Ca-activated chloride channel homolog
MSPLSRAALFVLPSTALALAGLGLGGCALSSSPVEKLLPAPEEELRLEGEPEEELQRESEEADAGSDADDIDFAMPGDGSADIQASRAPAPKAEERSRATRRPAGAEAADRFASEPAMSTGLSSSGGASAAGNVAVRADDLRSPAGQRPPSSAPPPAVVPESNTEDYTDYGVNGFTLTEQDGLSTFAVDVDTAAYTITRKKLREGYLPPTAAVRVEEFVNYFPYEYRQPDDGEPFTVDVEAAPSPWSPRNHLVRIGVQGKDVRFDTRRPVNLTFLVDVSGSMQSRDKIGLLKDTLKMLTEELEDGDTVSLVTYAGNTRVVLEPTPISQRADILRALDGLTAGGSTAMGAGIELAYGLAERNLRPGSVNRVIVCSDGDANVGIRSHEQLSSYIAGYAKKGITLTTLGFGNGNYKDTMMERLANDGDGNYYYIDSLQESRRLFVDKLSGTLEVIAKDVKIQVDWNADAVIAYRLVGYENRDVADRDFRNDAVDAGEIGAGHQVTAIYEVALKDDPTGGLGTVRIRNKAPGPDSPATERAYALPVSAVHASLGETSRQFRIQVAATAFAEILRGSPHLQEFSLRRTAALAREAARAEYPEDAELVELVERAAQLKGEGAMSWR